MAYKRSRKTFEADLQAEQSPYVSVGAAESPEDPKVFDEGAFVPVWKQNAVDDQGRRRFHGAFTGGYSAGYFNTVGSKDGFTPATFVSSRSKRNKDVKAQTADDFMDDEDREMVAASQTLRSTDAYTNLGTPNSDKLKTSSPLDLSAPNKDSVVLRGLRRMGWREGLGTGALLESSLAKTTPDRSPSGAEHGSQSLAFQNIAVVTLSRRRRKHRHGVDFQSEARLDSLDKMGNGHASSERRREVNPFDFLPARNRETKSAGGFGTGVLNDDDEDDDEYGDYAIGPSTSYKKVLDIDRKSKEKKKADLYPAKGSAASPRLKIKPSFKLRKSLLPDNGFRLCFDGKLPLEDFTLASSMGSMTLKGSATRRPRPTIPPGWELPIESATRKVNRYTSTADIAKTSTLDARARGAILGFEQLPSKSVFDFLSPEARERLAAATGRKDLPIARGESLPQTAKDRETAPATPEPVRKVDTVTETVSSMMASRFVRSSNTAAQPEADSGLDTPTKAPEKPLDAAEQAASMGMYGPMTRSVHEFYPARLLCKRFNVKVPNAAED